MGTTNNTTLIPFQALSATMTLYYSTNSKEGIKISALSLTNHSNQAVEVGFYLVDTGAAAPTQGGIDIWFNENVPKTDKSNVFFPINQTITGKDLYIIGDPDINIMMSGFYFTN